VASPANIRGQPLKGMVCGDNDRAPLVAFGDDLKKLDQAPFHGRGFLNQAAERCKAPALEAALPSLRVWN
jgi:hypothetical protein